SKPVLWAILGATLGVAVNVAGEFSWALVENLLLGLPMDAAMTATLLKIPGTFINGSFSVFVAVSVYIPLNASLIKAKLLKS
ncbi:MAG: hypothetical protein FWE80_02525, partial [Oscillospiraceae bacterium]|nr:hypothetical protein [Oscillospiraceae bacterium]